MSSSKKEKKPTLLVTCPYCKRQITTEVIILKGFMYGRPQTKGGPYYKFKCTFCHKEYNCFFEKEVFTRKATAKKALIVRLVSWMGSLVLHGRREARDLQAAQFVSIRADERENGQDARDRSSQKKEILPLIFRTHPELLTCFRVLGLRHDAPPRSIRKRYKVLVKTFHPDRTTHLPEKERAEATKKLVEINRAYGTIKEYFM